MKRFLLSALSLLLVAALLGLTGCGGGVEPGMGDPNEAPAIPVDKMKEMANMADGKTLPPGVKKLPEKGTGTGTSADKGKDAAPKK